MEQNQCTRLSIGIIAPDFTENSTFGPINMCDYNEKWVIFFSHPGDFTPSGCANKKTIYKIHHSIDCFLIIILFWNFSS